MRRDDRPVFVQGTRDWNKDAGSRLLPIGGRFRIWCSSHGTDWIQPDGGLIVAAVGIVAGMSDSVLYR